MKTWSVFRKTLLEFRRDPLVLALTLVFAPLFVLLYWLFFPSGSTTFTVLLQAPDPQDARLVVESLESLTYANGQSILRPRLIQDQAQAEKELRDRRAVVLMLVPEGFSSHLQQAAAEPGTPSVKVTFIGDLTNPYYPLAAIMAASGLDSLAVEFGVAERAIQIEEIALGASSARTEFETYVPGLLVFAAVMLVFLAAMTVAREVEAGTLERLRLSRLNAFEMLGGISAALLLVGLAALLLTYGTALLLGFRSQGSIGLAVLVTALTSLAIIGSGLLVAAFSRTVSQAFVIANFPLALFMFFTGAIFPIPSLDWLTVGGRTFGLDDLLAPTHAVVALNKVLTLGAGWQDIAFELAALASLSGLYFLAGAWLFQRRQLDRISG